MARHMQFLVLSTLLIALHLPPTICAAAKKPVDIQVSAKSQSATRAEIQVVVEIEKGWYIYKKLSDGTPGIATELTLELPTGVTTVGDWRLPTGLPYSKDPTSSVYQGKAKFSHVVEIAADAKSRDVGVKVRFQACNGKFCRPPKTVDVMVVLAEGEGEQGDDQDSPQFAQPAMLKVGDEPLNAAARVSYPSPAMYDVDGDGDLELVVGAISGTIGVYENSNNADGDPVWSKRKPLNSAEGKAIRVSNW